MRGEGRRFGPLDLIADVDEAVVDAHFELGGRGVPGSLVVVEFFETLEGVHQLLRLHRHREPFLPALEMQRQDMIPRTPIITLDGYRTRAVLDRKVVSDSAGTVADEVVGCGEAAAGDEGVEEVVEGFLEDVRRAKVRRDDFVACCALVHLDGFLMVNTLRTRDGLPLKQVILALSAISLEAGTHVWTRPDDGYSVFEALGDERVVHLAGGDGGFAFYFAGFDELRSWVRRRLTIRVGSW